MSEAKPSRFADSAGRAWAGRSFQANEFVADDGSAPKELMAALRDFRAGILGADAVIDRLRVSRLLVPLVANLAESETGAHGKQVDKSSELSIIAVETPDQQNALLAFSSTAAMQRWNTQARPVPTDAVRLALAAATEGATRIVLDALSDSEFVIRRPAIASIAQSLPWLAPESNPAVHAFIQNSLASNPAIMSFDLSSGDPGAKLQGPELKVTLRLRPGMERASVAQLVSEISNYWAQSEQFVSLVDSVELSLTS